MAAVGPPQQQVRMAQQQVWAALEVALRVPCLYIIDAIFNSYYDSSQSRLCIGLQIFLRLLGKDSGDSPRGQGVPCPGRTGAAGHLVVRGSGNTRFDCPEGPLGGVRGPETLVPALTAEWWWRVSVPLALGGGEEKAGLCEHAALCLLFLLGND